MEVPGKGPGGVEMSSRFEESKVCGRKAAGVITGVWWHWGWDSLLVDMQGHAGGKALPRDGKGES